MTAVTDEQLFTVLEWLKDNAKSAAQARAARLYTEEFLPALRARIASEAIAAGKSAAAADVEAKASDAYMTALQGYKVAVEQDELFRWHRVRGDAIIEVWRSSQANRRALEKVT